MKKGQSGGGAANLILIIGAMILIYVLFLPSDDRDDILDRDRTNGVIKVGDDHYERILLDEQPGTIVAQNEREFRHSIPSFVLRTEAEDQILRSIESVFLDKNNPNVNIPIFLDQRPQSSLMTFDVEDHSGALTVLLNDEQIFKGELDGPVDPISIQMRSENLLEFKVEGSPGWQFWKSNTYDIRNVQIVGTILNKDNQESVGTFFVTEDEARAEDVENAYLIYLVDCQTQSVGRLNVYLNDVSLSSRIPDCGQLDQTFFDPGLLVEGRNELRYQAEEGTYLIDRIVINTRLDDQRFPLYFFDINQTQLDALEELRANASVSLRFVNDPDERKEAVVRLNNHRLSVDTHQAYWTRRIEPIFLVEGSNSIRIEPENSLDVVDFEIVLTCKDDEDCE